MSADALLSRLEGVKRTGNGRWLARCPAHADKSPSLSVRELDDGRVLIHDIAGCGVPEILDSVGLTFDALFPEKSLESGKPERRPFFSADAFRAVGFESLIVALAATDMGNGKLLTEASKDRLLLAHQRIQGALSAAGLT